MRPQNVGTVSLRHRAVNDVSTKKAFEVAELVVLEHQTDRIVVETDAEQFRDVLVVQTRHDVRLTLKVGSIHTACYLKVTLWSASPCHSSATYGCGFHFRFLVLKAVSELMLYGRYTIPVP